jgi:uncharacterized protein
MGRAAALAVLLASLPAQAYTPPPIAGHVTDTAGKLTPQQVADLDHRLHLFREATGFEIAVFLVPSLHGETIEDVAYGTFHTWALGQKGQDNGVLLVIAPTERRVRIETGKGVEGALTDLQANDIIRQKIGPFLKQDEFYLGIRSGTEAIEHALAPTYAPAGEVAPPPPPPPVGYSSRPTSGFGTFCLILAVIVILILLRSRGGGGGGFYLGGGGWGGGGGDWGGGSSGGNDGFSGGGGDSGGGGSSDGY